MMRRIIGGMTMVGVLLCASLGNSAHAAPIDIEWTNLSAGEFNTSATDISRTFDDFSVSARGYRVSVPNGGGADTVSGPLPAIDIAQCTNLNPAICAGGRDNGLRLQINGLGIRSASSGATGLNGYVDSSGNSLTEFIAFSFSETVDIGSILVDPVSNFGRSIWFASGDSEPDFSGGLGGALSVFDLENSPDDATDGLFSHAANLTDITTLIVGAPFTTGDFFGVELGSSNFYINGFGDVSLSDTAGVDPGPAPPTATVPAPASLPLMLMGLFGVFVSRSKKCA